MCTMYTLYRQVQCVLFRKRHDTTLHTHCTENVDWDLFFQVRSHCYLDKLIVSMNSINHRVAIPKLIEREALEFT